MKIDLNSDDIASFQKGDEKAFNAVYGAFCDHIYIYSCRYLEKEDAEDVVAETFLVLWHNKEKMESTDHIRNFLYMVARNKALTLIKKNRYKRTFVGEDVLSEIPEDECYIVENELLVELVTREILDRVDILPTRYRQVFKYYMANMTAAEIAAVMKINISSVYIYLTAAKKKIRASLKKKGIEPVATKWFFV